MSGKFVMLSTLVVLSIFLWMKKPGRSTDTAHDFPGVIPISKNHEEHSSPDVKKVALFTGFKKEKPPLDLRAASIKWENIGKLLLCSQMESCMPSEKESREKHFYLKERLLEDIGWFQQFGADTEEARKSSYKAALQILHYPEEEVQYAALSWLLELPVSPRTMDSIESEMKDVVDPNLIILLLHEFKRYQGTPLESRALRFMKSIFTEGSIFASRELARSIGIVLTHENQFEVNDWLREVSPESAKYRLLSDSLSRFRRGKSM